MSDEKRVLVIGGGVIGMACGHYLRQAGFQVTVIDQAKIGDACSKGNCGFVCPSHVLPLAEPGAIGSSVAMLLQSGGPLKVKWRFDRSFWNWMANFAKRCNERDMLESARGIQALLASSMELYETLVADGSVHCEWQKRGMLFAYKRQAALDAYASTNRLLTEKFNEPARKLSGKELQEFEPALAKQLAGAWYFEHDAHLRPDRLLATWRSYLAEQGVRFIEQRTLQRFDQQAKRASCAIASGDPFVADYFVVATGAWTPRLASILGYQVPIEPGKGYSVTLPRPEKCPTYPIIFPERRVAVTPMESGLRLGSMMEFVGYDESIRPERLRVLTSTAAEYLPDLKLDETWPEKWFGWRPMTYDSRPVIGPCPGFDNVFLATGHNMLGLSMAPATGKLVAELVTGARPHISASPYDPARF